LKNILSQELHVGLYLENKKYVGNTHQKFLEKKIELLKELIFQLPYKNINLIYISRKSEMMGLQSKAEH